MRTWVRPPPLPRPGALHDLERLQAHRPRGRHRRRLRPRRARHRPPGRHARGVRGRAGSHSAGADRRTARELPELRRPRRTRKRRRRRGQHDQGLREDRAKGRRPPAARHSAGARAVLPGHAGLARRRARAVARNGLGLHRRSERHRADQRARRRRRRQRQCQADRQARIHRQGAWGRGDQRRGLHQVPHGRL